MQNYESLSYAKRILLTSDLHISTPEDPVLKNFQNLLEKEFLHNSIFSPQDQELWLLGDIFDVLIGPFGFWLRKYLKFFSLLNRLLSEGVKIVWLQGNHDFFIEDLEHQLSPGLMIKDDFVCINLATGHKVFLGHGDLVDSTDTAYLRWRKTTRNPLLRALLMTAPNVFAENYLAPFASRISNKSKTHSRRYLSDLKWVETQKNLFRQYANDKFSAGFSGVFLGHNHISDSLVLGTHHFYMNCGSAEEFKNGTFRFVEWIPESGSPPRLKVHPATELDSPNG